eukprot:TRINITY_DN11669_c0_g1_i2.p1 TRINITY_DN11669_c0_g1~~TRINITY_DN11669_c0_g1_i2.p1  ORF type:complete len:868 (+),score=229.30 TRINITY_DN11669_c0_g1_i2:183-2786(+)
MTAIPDWSVENVSAWLRSKHLDKLVEPFQENYVDGQLLLELDDEMLEELGIASKLQRKRFLLSIHEAVESNLTMVDKKTRNRPAEPSPPNTAKPSSRPTASSGASGGRFSRRAVDNAEPPSMAAIEQEIEDAVYMSVDPVTESSTDPAPSNAVEDAGYMDLGSVRAARESSRKAPDEDDTYMDLSHEAVHSNLENAAMTNLDAFRKAMDHLANMFPTAPRSRLEEALKHNQGNVDKAVDYCLAAEFAHLDGSQQGPLQAQQRPAPHRVATDAEADWLHDYISRDVAETLMQQQGMSEGLFLIRRSTSVDGAYVLSLVVKGEVKHHIIYASPGQYEIFDIVCPSLTDLVGYLSDYQRQDGWYTPLQMHVPRSAALHHQEFADYASIPGQRVTASINRERAQSVHTSRSRRHQRSSPRAIPQSTASPNRGMPAPVPGDALPRGSPSFSFTSQDARRSMKQSRHPSSKSRDNGYHFRPQEFDLDTNSPLEPYKGDKQWPVAAHESLEIEKFGLTNLGQGRQPCAIRTLQTDVQILLPVNGPVLGNIPYALIESMAAQDKVLRLVVGSGKLMGVYYFDAANASTAKQICQTIETNARNMILAEDRRIAQLMQNEEFVAQMQNNPELATAVQASQSKSATPGQRSKARAALKSFAKRFKRTPRAERPNPQAVAANTPALVPAAEPRQDGGFHNPDFGTTRPGDPLPPVPGEGMPEPEDDVWNFDPERDGIDPSYAEVGPANGDIGTEPSYMTTEAVLDQDDPFAEQPGDFGTAPTLNSDLPVYLAIRSRAPQPYDPDSLAYEVGDEVYVTDRGSNGTWEGVCRGKSGHFPAIDVAPASDADATNVEVELEEPGNGQQPPPFEAPFQSPPHEY